MILLCNISWKLILTFIFIRPFISSETFPHLVFLINTFFILASLLYLFKNKVKNNCITLFVFIFFSTIILSVILNIPFYNSLFQGYEYISLLFLFYIISSVRETKKTYQLIIVLLLSAIAVSLSSLRSLLIISKYTLEYLSLTNIDYTFAKEFISRKRAFAPFISPNLLANYLTMIIIITIGIIIKKIKQNKKDPLFIISVICLSTTSLALFFTKSVGGWLTFFIAITIFFILGKTLNQKAIILPIIVCIIIFTTLLSRTKSTKEHSISYKPIQQTMPLFSIEQRKSYWKETIALIKNHPINGIGIGKFYLPRSNTLYAHNSYLQLWAETGILSILSFLGLIFIFIKKSLLIINLKKENYYLLGISISGLSFILHNIIDFSLFIPQTSFLWWIILGIIAANSRDENTQKH
ncbi:MAG: O-antigen ligase family protein [Candidatus Omnitrophica bacterium]|nr:O-antigen ligase family protein [Candidatus Omnitrophota bacterium]